MAKDAIALLEADHRQVEFWFEQLTRARDKDRQFDLTEKICEALKLHARLEEEIFYPAFVAATGDKSAHHEAEIEHAAAEKLIAELEVTSPREPYFPARVKLLSELIAHHTNEEESSRGMFAEARKSGMPLDEVGRALRVRKLQLEGSDPILAINSDGQRRLRSSASPSIHPRLQEYV